jgi:hypothetical protein
MLTISCELTDLYCGEANYSWVKREELSLPDGSSDLSIMRAAKRALGLSGVRCRTESYGDSWALYPSGSLTVAFISVSL